MTSEANIGASIVLGIAGVLSLLMYSVLSSKQLVGWDTPTYVYYAGVLVQDGLQRFLVITSYGGQGLLFYLLIASLHLVSGISLIEADKIVATFVFGGILGAIPFTLLKWTGRVLYSIVGLIFAAVWVSPYILASNLHSNELGMLFAVLLIAVAPPAVALGDRRVGLATALCLLASFSHPQMSGFMAFLLIITTLPFALSQWNLMMLLRALGLALACLSQTFFSLILLGKPLLLGPAIDPGQVAGALLIAHNNPFSLAVGIEYMGGYLFPLYILSVVLLSMGVIRQGFNNIKNSGVYASLFVVIWSTSTIIVWLLSADYWILDTYADRLLVWSPFPLVVTLGLKSISDRLAEG